MKQYMKHIATHNRQTCMCNVLVNENTAKLSQNTRQTDLWYLRWASENDSLVGNKVSLQYLNSFLPYKKYYL